MIYFSATVPIQVFFLVLFLSGTMLCWLVMAIELEVEFLTTKLMLCRGICDFAHAHARDVFL